MQKIEKTNPFSLNSDGLNTNPSETSSSKDDKGCEYYRDYILNQFNLTLEQYRNNITQESKENLKNYIFGMWGYENGTLTEAEARDLMKPNSPGATFYDYPLSPLYPTEESLIGRYDGDFRIRFEPTAPIGEDILSVMAYISRNHKYNNLDDLKAYRTSSYNWDYTNKLKIEEHTDPDNKGHTGYPYEWQANWWGPFPGGPWHGIDGDAWWASPTILDAKIKPGYIDNRIKFVIRYEYEYWVPPWPFGSGQLFTGSWLRDVTYLMYNIYLKIDMSGNTIYISFHDLDITDDDTENPNLVLTNYNFAFDNVIYDSYKFLSVGGYATDASGISTFNGRVLGQPLTSGIGGLRMDDPGISYFSYHLFNPRTPGFYTARIECIDGDNDRTGDQLSDAEEFFFWVIDDDTTIPTATLDHIPGATYGDLGEISLSFNDPQSPASAKLNITGPNSFSYIKSYWTEGTHTVDLNSLAITESGQYIITLDVRNNDRDEWSGDEEFNSLTITTYLEARDVTPPTAILEHQGGTTDGAPGQLFLSFTDLESDATAALSIQGPNGFSHIRFYASEGSDTINLNAIGVCEPGEYSMTLDVENSDGEANSESLTLLLTDDDVVPPEVLVNNLWEFQDNVEFLDIYLTPTDPSGISNVYANFSGNEYYYDSIDPDGTYHILIPNPHELGTFDFELWVWDNDNDRTDDKKNSMIPLTFSIIDDDIDPPIVDIGNDWTFEDEGDLLEIVFTATDVSGISDIYAGFSGEEYYVGDPDEEGYYHLFLPNPHNLGYYSFDLWVWDNDNDRLDDSEAYITTLSFEIIDDDTEAPLVEVSENWIILDSDGFLEILVEATDPSGIHAVYAKFGDLEYHYDSIDGDGNYHISIPNPIELGLYNFELWVWDDDNDHIGDRKAVTTTLTFTVIDDDTDPPDFSELNTWEIPDNVENLEIIMDVFDPSGISEVYALFDGDTYAGIFINGYYYIDIPNPRTPGQYHVDVWAWDNDNDREGDRTARDYTYWFTVFDDDTTAPTVILPEGLIIEDKDQYLEIILEAWDLSGIHDVYAIFDSNNYQGTFNEGDGLYHIFVDNPHELGTYTVDVWVWDDDYDCWDGDRKEFTDSLSFTVEDDDVEAPSIFLYENSYSWDGTKIELTFTITAMDSSGISEISAEIGGNTFYAYLVDVATFKVSLEPAIYAIQISATDNDNDRMDDSLTAYLYDELIFDLTPPLTSLEFSPFYDDELGKIFVTTTTIFTLGATDDVSGVAHTYYWINNNPVDEDSLTFSLTDRPDGTYRISFYSIDSVGNVEGVKYVDVILVSLNIESYISNGVSGDIINEFDVIFRKCKENGIEGFKLVATNPGQIFYHIDITNYWPISVDELIVNTNIPSDFEMKGYNPVHVFLDGEQITDSCILVNGLITLSDIPSGSLVEIIVHLDYGLKDMFYEILEDFWLKIYSFEPVIQGYGGDLMDVSNYLEGTYTALNELKAFEKKTTAIAGFVMNENGYQITGAIVQLQQSDGTLFETITDENGFYFFTDIPSGDFQIRIVHEDITTEWEWVSVLKEHVTWFDHLVPILIP